MATSAAATHEKMQTAIRAATWTGVVKFCPQTKAQKDASVSTRNEAMEEDGPEDAGDSTFAMPQASGRPRAGRSKVAVAKASPSASGATGGSGSRSRSRSVSVSGSSSGSSSRSSSISSTSSTSSTRSVLSMKSAGSDGDDNQPGIGLHDASGWTTGQEKAEEVATNFAIASATTHVTGASQATTVAFGALNARAMFSFKLLMQWWTGV